MGERMEGINRVQKSEQKEDTLKEFFRGKSGYLGRRGKK